MIQLKIECVHVCVTGSPCCTVGKKNCMEKITIKKNKNNNNKILGKQTKTANDLATVNLRVYFNYTL